MPKIKCHNVSPHLPSIALYSRVIIQLTSLWGGGGGNCMFLIGKPRMYEHYSLSKKVTFHSIFTFLGVMSGSLV